eukprot:m.29513 g.29513  ORF g.29513 m.29513 type:complete len:125 (+) comp4672_c0_seq1:557-931(+)
MASQVSRPLRYLGTLPRQFLAIKVTKEGQPGAKSKTGDKLSMHYTGTLENGSKFDSSVGKKPFVFTLGAGEVIKGWDAGLQDMAVGEKRTLVIQPQWGYGARGAGGVIPPNAVLNFDVELLKIN